LGQKILTIGSIVKQLVNQTLSEQLRDRIEERIISGLYPPGTKLDEVDLAVTFNVSRTPIREALIQLSATGLIDIRPRRGAVVAEFSPARLAQMFDVMAEMEAICARRAALSATDEDRQTLREAHHACEDALKANDPDRYYRLNEQFHMAVYSAGHNDFLTEQTAALHRRLHPYRRLQLRSPNRMEKSFMEHAQILEAILKGDANTSAELIQEHVRIQNWQFSELLSDVISLKDKVSAGRTSGC